MQKIIFLMVLNFILSTHVHAIEVNMINIQSEADPGKRISLAVDVNEKNEFLKLIYYSANQGVLTYTINEIIAEPKTLLSKLGVEILTASVKNYTKNSMNLTLTFLKKHSIFGKNEYGLKHFKMFYQAPSNEFITYDVDTQKNITNAHVFVNWDGTKQKGISRIETY